MRAHELTEKLGATMPNYPDFRDSVKFDLGDVHNVVELGEISKGEMCKPPYPVSLFQFVCKGAPHVYFVLLKDYGAGVKCYGFAKEYRSYGITWSQRSLELDIKGYAVKLEFEHLSRHLHSSGVNWDDITEEEHLVCTWWIQRILYVVAIMEVISCTNVSIVHREAPAFINNKRKAKNKPPFYSYKTLHFNPVDSGEKIITSRGGTHASPRVHLRRGHIRRLSNNRRVWVQQCVVGSKQLGSVEKDYCVETA